VSGAAMVRPRERRRHGRICVPFRTNVVGKDADGAPISANTVADNLGAGGLYFRIMQRPMIGSRLLIKISLSIAHGLDIEGPFVEMDGEVLRVEKREGGAWGVATKTVSTRFV
jgi:hypothetical protein